MLLERAKIAAFPHKRVKNSRGFAVPIYAYKCTSCGHAQDVLQKMSDPLLTICPECSQSTYAKQVTAAGFQLKGNGWYATDFRGNDNKSSAATTPGSGGSETSSAAPAAASAAGETT